MCDTPQANQTGSAPGHLTPVEEEFCDAIDDAGGFSLMAHDLSRRVLELEAEREQLIRALHETIIRPMGVVPDSALPFYERGYYERNGI